MKEVICPGDKKSSTMFSLQSGNVEKKGMVKVILIKQKDKRDNWLRIWQTDHGVLGTMVICVQPA